MFQFIQNLFFKKSKNIIATVESIDLTLSNNCQDIEEIKPTTNILEEVIQPTSNPDSDGLSVKFDYFADSISVSICSTNRNKVREKMNEFLYSGWESEHPDGVWFYKKDMQFNANLIYRCDKPTDSRIH